VIPAGPLQAATGAADTTVRAWLQDSREARRSL